MRWFRCHLSENSGLGFICLQTSKDVLCAQSNKTPLVTTNPQRGPCIAAGCGEQTHADAFELF